MNKVAGTDDRVRVIGRVTVQIEGAVIRVRLIRITARIQGGAIEIAVIGDQQTRRPVQGVTVPMS